MMGRAAIRATACTMLGGLLLLWIVDGLADALLQSEIRAQPLAAALAEFAHQTGLQLVYVSDVLKDQKSRGARAGVSTTDALTQLLDGTGLTFEFLNQRAVRIFAEPKAAESGAVPTPRPTNLTRGAEQEVLVTAMALSEPANHVPLSITVWTSRDLQVADVNDTRELANLTPGVEFDSYSNYGAGITTNIAIRGINARDGSTTAVYIDDTPLPTDRASVFGRDYPLLFDLDRVEVLRGPQGVLLGEGAEGGALRFITTQPSLTAFSSYARAEGLTTEGGAPGYEVGAALGGPLAADVLGFRVAAWSQRSGGYVDRVDPFNDALVDPNANRSRREGLRAALMLAPLPSISIIPSFDYQRVYAHDTSSFFTYLSDPGNGVLQNGRLIAQPYEDSHTLLSLKIAGVTSIADVSAVTSYLRRKAWAIIDNTDNPEWRWPNPLGPEYPTSYADAAPVPQSLWESMTSVQLRATSPEPTVHLTWLLGIAYAGAHYQEDQDLVPPTLADNGPIGAILVGGPCLLTCAVGGTIAADNHTSQTAAYAQLDAHLGARLTLTVGARVERDSYRTVQVANLVGTTLPAADFEGSATVTAPRLALSFAADERHLYYASLAKGYRMGGANVYLSNCDLTPSVYAPDYIWSLELGAKSATSDGRLQLNGAVFHMVWHDIQTQVSLPACGAGYTANTGAASSNGVDLGVQALLGNHLTLRLIAAYADAHYTQTENAGALGGYETIESNGDSIGVVPLVAPPLSTTLWADYQLSLANQLSLSLRAGDIFHSRNPGPFTTDDPNGVVYAPTRTADPATNRVDGGASLAWPRLELSLLVSNVFNSQPTLQRRNFDPSDTLFYAVTFRPRTVALAVTWRFSSAAP